LQVSTRKFDGQFHFSSAHLKTEEKAAFGSGEGIGAWAGFLHVAERRKDNDCAQHRSVDHWRLVFNALNSIVPTITQRSRLTIGSLVN
jgi:hypothetical protein